MVQYKLYYFPARGRAEVIRLIFAVADVAYEDIRIPGTEWPQHKASMPLGQMPVLEVDGVKMAQSAAIGRFLARKFNLAGKTDIDQYRGDMISDTMDDLGRKYPWTEKDEAKKEELKKEFLEVTIPEGLKKIEKLYREFNNGKDCFFVGDLSVVDLAFITFLDFLLPSKGDLLTDVPALAGLYKRVREVPTIKAWIEKRPQTQF